MKLSDSPALPWFALGASLIVAFGVWHWAAAVLVPTYTQKVLAQKRPIGNNSDLYPRWLGTRELLLLGRDPYSPEVTREIQIGFYGRPLNPQNPSDPAARESFVYPLYVAFLFAPTVNLPFRTVAEVSRWLLLVAIAGSVPLWMDALRLRFRWPLVISGMMLAASSYPAVEEYAQQNLAALVIFVLAAAAAAAARRWLMLSGFLLALATVKPDTAGPVILWFLLWAAAGWRQRSRLLWSFAGTLTVLVIAAQAVSPGWIPRFVAAVREYPAYGTDPSILQVLLPIWLADLLVAVIVVLAAVMCWRWRKAKADSNHFGWALAWVTTATLMILPKLAAYNELLLIPALLLLAARYQRLADRGLLARALTKGAFACQIWQWLAATALAICAFVLPFARLRTAAELPLYTLLALPPLTFLAVLSNTFSLRGSPVET